jgi:DNA polymerase-3 subunit beta
VGADRKIVDRSSFIVALRRAAILSNEVQRRLKLMGRVKIVAHNPLHEEAEEVVEATTNFDQLAIGFNVTYLLDALSAIDAERVTLEMRDANSSCLITAGGGGADRHVVMPLKL